MKNKLIRVIEVGAGNYSTKFLGLILGSLNSKLISIEDDINWYNILYENYNINSFVDLIYSLEPCKGLLEIASNRNFDLIFIDNGKKPEDRIKIIETAIKISFRFIVVHDVQEPIYNRLIKSIIVNDLAYAEIGAFYPHTGIIFTNKDQDIIYKLTNFIRQNKSISVIDYDSWNNLINTLG